MREAPVSLVLDALPATRNSRRAMAHASGPDKRTMAMPPTPGGVESAAMVSSRV